MAELYNNLINCSSYPPYTKFYVRNLLLTSLFLTTGYDSAMYCFSSKATEHIVQVSSIGAAH